MKDGRDFWWHEQAVRVPSYCPPEIMNSEDPLFILYVSRVGPSSSRDTLRLTHRIDPPRRPRDLPVNPRVWSTLAEGTSSER
jgi:hypothetical protein